MTKLEAVNEMLEAIAQPPVAALDTGTSSDAGLAEIGLDRETKRILGRGWACNTLPSYEVFFPDRSIGVTGGSGTFTYQEVVTGGTSGATGVYNRITSNVMHLHAISGTFQSGETLTGGTSGATKTTNSAVTTLTSNLIAADTNWLHVAPNEHEFANVVVVGGFFYDRDPSRSTSIQPLYGYFTDGFRVDALTQPTFANLPQSLAEFITAQAAMNYQVFVRGQATPEAIDRVQIAKVKAKQDDQEIARVNFVRDDETIAFKGWRRGAR